MTTLFRITGRFFKFLRSLYRHSMNEGKLVELETYVLRMNQCNECDRRSHIWCEECGCLVEEKCWWESEDCPLNRWVLKNEE